MPVVDANRTRRCRKRTFLVFYSLNERRNSCYKEGEREKKKSGKKRACDDDEIFMRSRSKINLGLNLKKKGLAGIIGKQLKTAITTRKRVKKMMSKAQSWRARCHWTVFPLTMLLSSNHGNEMHLPMLLQDKVMALNVTSDSCPTMTQGRYYALRSREWNASTVLFGPYATRGVLWQNSIKGHRLIRILNANVICRSNYERWTALYATQSFQG